MGRNWVYFKINVSIHWELHVATDAIYDEQYVNNSELAHLCMNLWLSNNSLGLPRVIILDLQGITVLINAHHNTTACTQLIIEQLPHRYKKLTCKYGGGGKLDSWEVEDRVVGCHGTFGGVSLGPQMDNCGWKWRHWTSKLVDMPLVSSKDESE